MKQKKNKGIFSCWFKSSTKSKVKPSGSHFLIAENLGRKNSKITSSLNEALSRKHKNSIPKSAFENLVSLAPQVGNNIGRKTLILDLDETWAHSAFGAFPNSNFKQKIMYDGVPYTIHVLKRPFLQEFLEAMSKIYEIIFYTASVQEYANLVIDFIDPDNLGSARLFRENCRHIEGSFVKDLTNLGRDLKKTVIIDNSPIAYCLNPNNGLPIKSFYDDINDDELLHMIPILEHISTFDNVQKYIKEQINIITKENEDQVNNRLVECSTKQESGYKSKFDSNQKYSSDVIENYKEMDEWDNLEIEDLNYWDQDNFDKDLSQYEIEKKDRPTAMLARYNEFSAIHRPTDSVKRNADYMQIGQGSQRQNKLKSSAVKVKTTKPAVENNRYNKVALKNSFVDTYEEDKNKTKNISKLFAFFGFFIFG